MRLSWRKWGVSGSAWLAVVALGGMAFAGATSGSEPSAWLSPAGVVEGKTLSSGEPFEMTLHFAGDPDSVYDLAVTYDGDGIGVCQSDVVTLETNSEGKATFDCMFTTVENLGSHPLTGPVTFTVTLVDEVVASAVASLTVSPAEVEEAPEPEGSEQELTQGEGEQGPNHGHCVSFWTHEAKAQGLTGKHKGAFVSAIAQNPDAVADKDEPGAECDFQDALDAALEEQATADAAAAEVQAAKAAAKEQRRSENAKGSKPGEEGAPSE